MSDHTSADAGEQFFDVAVLGGGLAGLAAANAAARAGARTVLLEAHGLGGRAKSVERGGLLLNEGPHALYSAGEGMRVLASLGISLPGHSPLSPVRLSQHGRLHAAPFVPSALATTSLLSAREKLAFTATYLKVLRADLSALNDVTFGSWLDRAAPVPVVRSVIETIARVATYTNGPSTIVASAVLAQLRLAAKGVQYLDGGWRSLVEALAGAARRGGVVLRDHCAVDGVVRDGDGWRVSTPAGVVSCGAVVVAAGGAGVAARLLGVDASVIGPAGAPVEASVLDLILDRVPQNPVVFAMDRPLYLSTHCPPAKLGDGVLVSVMCYRSMEEDRSVDDMRAELRGFFDAVDTAPPGGASATVLDERYLHRLVVAHGRPGVELGGTAGRPAVRVAGLAGAFIAGDWVGEHGLLADASLASGWQAGEAAAGVRTAAVAASR